MLPFMKKLFPLPDVSATKLRDEYRKQILKCPICLDVPKNHSFVDIASIPCHEREERALESYLSEMQWESALQFQSANETGDIYLYRLLRCPTQKCCMLKVLLRFSPHKPDEAMLFMNLNMKDAEHLMAILDKRWIDI